jgi:hypothetical protein
VTLSKNSEQIDDVTTHVNFPYYLSYPFKCLPVQFAHMFVWPEQKIPERENSLGN